MIHEETEDMTAGNVSELAALVITAMECFNGRGMMCTSGGLHPGVTCLGGLFVIL